MLMMLMMLGSHSGRGEKGDGCQLMLMLMLDPPAAAREKRLHNFQFLFHSLFAYLLTTSKSRFRGLRVLHCAFQAHGFVSCPVAFPEHAIWLGFRLCSLWICGCSEVLPLLPSYWCFYQHWQHNAASTVTWRAPCNIKTSMSEASGKLKTHK